MSFVEGKGFTSLGLVYSIFNPTSLMIFSFLDYAIRLQGKSRSPTVHPCKHDEPARSHVPNEGRVKVAVLMLGKNGKNEYIM